MLSGDLPIISELCRRSLAFQLLFSQLQSHTVCYIVLHGVIYLFTCFRPPIFIKTANYSNYRNAQNYTTKEKTTQQKREKNEKDKLYPAGRQRKSMGKWEIRPHSLKKP